MTQVPREIYRHWVHSQEEDIGDIEVYRPADYPFPPARGRTGFEIKENGDFIQYAIAPTDGSLHVPGHWKSLSGSVMQVKFEGSGSPTLRIEILSVSPELLKLRQAVSRS